MATNATSHFRGRMVRTFHWLFRSHRQFAMCLTGDVLLALLVLPLWVHIVLAVSSHLSGHLIGRIHDPTR